SAKPTAKTKGCIARSGGVKKKTNGIVTISSSTTQPGSLRAPSFVAATVQMGTEIANRATMAPNWTAGEGMKAIPAASGSPNRVPKVPGAKGTRPIQKPVASTTAGCRQALDGGCDVPWSACRGRAAASASINSMAVEERFNHVRSYQKKNSIPTSVLRIA